MIIVAKKHCFKSVNNNVFFATDLSQIMTCAKNTSFFGAPAALSNTYFLLYFCIKTPIFLACDAFRALDFSNLQKASVYGGSLYIVYGGWIL